MDGTKRSKNMRQIIHEAKEEMAKRLGYKSWEDFMEMAPRTALTCLEQEVEPIVVAACNQHLETYLKEQAAAVNEAKLAYSTVAFCQTAYKNHLVNKYPVKL
jgi:hypothetical protein